MGGKLIRVLKGSLGAVCFMGFTWLLVVGVLKTTKITFQSTPKSQIMMMMIAKERQGVNWNYDPNYVSKRRVPSGPDPIHNRREGKYGQPRGRV